MQGENSDEMYRMYSRGMSGMGPMDHRGMGPMHRHGMGPMYHRGIDPMYRPFWGRRLPALPGRGNMYRSRPRPPCLAEIFLRGRRQSARRGRRGDSGSCERCYVQAHRSNESPAQDQQDLGSEEVSQEISRGRGRSRGRNRGSSGRGGKQRVKSNESPAQDQQDQGSDEVCQEISRGRGRARGRNRGCRGRDGKQRVKSNESPAQDQQDQGSDEVCQEISRGRGRARGRNRGCRGRDGKQRVKSNESPAQDQQDQGSDEVCQEISRGRGRARGRNRGCRGRDGKQRFRSNESPAQDQQDEGREEVSQGISRGRGRSRGRNRGCRGRDGKQIVRSNESPAHDQGSEEVSQEKSRGRGRSRGHKRGCRGGSCKGDDIREMGVEQMEELLEAHSMEILLQLSSKDSGFMGAIQEDNPEENKERVGLILMLLGKALENPVLPHSTVTLLETVSTSHWLETLPSVFGNADLSVAKMRQYLSCTSILMKKLLSKIPSVYQTICPLIQETAKNILSHKNVKTQASKDSSPREDILLLIAEFRDLTQIPKTSTIVNSAANEQRFCEISVTPTKEDISGMMRPNISAIKAQGAYKDLQDYLDVNFRLLRADFTEPLRKGIQGLVCEGQGQSLERNANSDVHVFENVNIQGLVPLHNGVALCLVFDAFSLQNKRREWSREFIYGSLVCLMGQNQCYFGTVANTTKVRRGKLEVSMEAETSIFVNHDPCDKFVMVESQALFEAYRHVLVSLQSIAEFGYLVMSKYIVNCDMTSKAPGYLKPDTQYCFQGVNRVYRAPVFSKKLWPSKSALRLNSAQYEAFQLALTHEFAVIQGPPGTGKTYLGLKIAEVLLKNVKSGRLESHVGHKPIMVVCYTNHALDQFLEGIHDAVKHVNILRIGGRSQSKKLRSCTMKEKKHKFLKSKKNSFSAVYSRISEELEYYGTEIATYNKLLELTQSNVLKLEVLKSVMDDNHYKQLHASSKLEATVLVEWLVPGYCEMQLQDQSKGLDGGCQSIQDKDPAEVNARAPLCETPQIEEVDLLNIPLQDETHQAKDVTRCSKLFMTEDTENIDTTIGCHSNQDTELEELYSRATLGQNQQIEASDLMETELQDEIHQAANVAAYEKVCTTEENKNIRNDNWQYTKGQRKEMMKTLKNQLRRTDAMADEDVCVVHDALKLEVDQRWRLYRYWQKQYLKQERTHILPLVTEYNKLAEELNEIRQLTDLGVMQTADVIGMTTTGAARLQSLIQALGPAILIIEEAAEIMEAHTVTALNPKCEHVILIGDHQQLRPKPNEYELERDFNLDLSMFERLVNNGITCATLATQHRMRPEIARLLLPIYPHLINHESVSKYTHVRGIKHNMYFIDHRQYENSTSNSITHQMSKANQFEAEYVTSLARYLIQPGYKNDHVTVLTLYNGQLELLKRCMRDSFFQGVQLSTVDNYQGEENDIVVLSLVRSNKAGKLGFLGVDNRICVALSRAKIGLFMIGNFEMLSNHGMWSKVLAQASNKLGPSLPLYCQNHPKAPGIDAHSAEDFRKAPEGGCLLPCKFTMKCGHVCQLCCHPYDAQHKEVKCGLPCTKQCPSGHQCQKMCSQQCRCPVMVEKLRNCGHTIRTMCYQDANEQECDVPLQYEMPGCGHSCPGTCSQKPKKCIVMVNMRRECGHDVAVECYIYQTDPPDMCLQTVSVTLSCGHKATSECRVSASNIKCLQAIKKTWSCGHTYEGLCHDKPARCSVFVEQRQCGHVVNAPCYSIQGVKCTETMKVLPCGHKAAAECHVSIDTISCKQKVDCTLACGHTSLGLCSQMPVNCSKVVEKLRPCGHKVSIACHASPSGKCEQLVLHKMACGHTWYGMCSKIPTKCFELVSKVCHKCGHERSLEFCYATEAKPCKGFVSKLLPCGHTVPVECCLDPELVRCTKSKTQSLSCGHTYTGPCYDMSPRCMVKVPLKCVCGHMVNRPCSLKNYHDRCPKCTQNKETSCAVS